MSGQSDADRALQAWLGIESWLREHSPRGVSDLNAPASEADMMALESASGLLIPEALRVVLSLHDGEKGSSLYGNDFDFLSSREMAEHWRMHVAILDHLPLGALAGEFDPEIMSECDSGVRPLIANRMWLPIAENNGDVTRYIDFDPAPGGHLGQVIEVDPEATTWRVLAPSFGTYLADRRASLGSIP